MPLGPEKGEDMPRVIVVSADPKKSLTLSIQDLARGLCLPACSLLISSKFGQQLLLTFGQIDRGFDHHVAEVAVGVATARP